METEKLRKIFVTESEELNKNLHRKYAQSRELAQQHKWEEHIELVKSMLPTVAYLEQDDFMSRLLGRLAWSYIRIEDKGKASKLLQYSEEYDLWQAAANYFWSSEYSFRQMNMHDYAGKCLVGFRNTVKKIDAFSNLTTELPKDDLELAVMFYEKLIEHEEESDVFADNSAKSDKARFYELKARLDQNILGYERAEEYYKDAGLYPYATCCQAFRLMYEAVKQNEIVKRKENLNNASNALKKSNVFADEHIKALLIKFIDLREAFCDLYLTLENNRTKADDIVKQVKHIDGIYKKEDTDCFYKLSLNNASFSDSYAYKEFSKTMTDLLVGKIDFYDINEIIKFDSLLDEVQNQLPSYTFSIFKKQK